MPKQQVPGQAPLHLDAELVRIKKEVVKFLTSTEGNTGVTGIKENTQQTASITADFVVSQLDGIFARMSWLEGRERTWTEAQKQLDEREHETRCLQDTVYRHEQKMKDMKEKQEESLKKSNNALHALHERNTALENECNQERLKFEDAERGKEELREELVKVQEGSRILNQIREHVGPIHKVAEEGVELVRAVEAQDPHLKSAAEQFEESLIQKNEANGKITDLSAQLDTAKQKIDELTQEVEDHKQKIEDTVREKNEKVEKAIVSLAEEQKNSKEVAAELKVVKKTAKRVWKERKSLEGRKNQMVTDLQKAEKKFSVLQKQIAAQTQFSVQRYDKLKTLLTQTETELKAANDLIQEKTVFAERNQAALTQQNGAQLQVNEAVMRPPQPAVTFRIKFEALQQKVAEQREWLPEHHTNQAGQREELALADNREQLRGVMKQKLEATNTSSRGTNAQPLPTSANEALEPQAKRLKMEPAAQEKDIAEDVQMNGDRSEQVGGDDLVGPVIALRVDEMDELAPQDDRTTGGEVVHRNRGRQSGVGKQTVAVKKDGNRQNQAEAAGPNRRAEATQTQNNAQSREGTRKSSRPRKPISYEDLLDDLDFDSSENDGREVREDIPEMRDEIDEMAEESDHRVENAAEERIARLFVLCSGYTREKDAAHPNKKKAIRRREEVEAGYENQLIATMEAFEGNQPNPGDVVAFNGTEAEQRRAASLRALVPGYTKERDPSHPANHENRAEKSSKANCKAAEFYEKRLIAMFESIQGKPSGADNEDEDDGAGPSSANQ